MITTADLDQFPVVPLHVLIDNTALLSNAMTPQENISFLHVLLSAGMNEYKNVDIRMFNEADGALGAKVANLLKTHSLI